MAKAKAKIGRILYKILKDKAKARVLFYEVTIFVFNEENNHLKSHQWCKDALADLKEI